MAAALLAVVLAFAHSSHRPVGWLPTVTLRVTWRGYDTAPSSPDDPWPVAYGLSAEVWARWGFPAPERAPDRDPPRASLPPPEEEP